MTMMTKKMKMRRKMKMKSNFIFAAALLFAVAGCDKSITYEYRQERSEKSYQSAIDELNAGNVDEAVKHLSDAIKASPGNASARFQLAVVLQENKKDYLEAYCNFAEYLRIAGDSDKSGLARERMRQCREMIFADRKNGNSAAILKELDLARAELAKADKSVLELTAERDKYEERIQKLQTKVDQLTKMINRLGDVEDEPANLRPFVVSRPVNEESARPPSNEVKAGKESENADQASARKVSTPVSGERNAEKPLGLNPEAMALNDEEERELATKSGSDLLPRAPAKENGDVKTAGRPTPPKGFYKNEKKDQKPEFYIVKEGEGLMQIAKRFYGDKSKWKKIREANKATVGPNGQVRAGQKLRLP